MLGMFVKVKINQKKFTSQDELWNTVKYCPVNVFKFEGGRVIIDEENEDECTFCNICIENSPEDGIEIIKLY